MTSHWLMCHSIVTLFLSLAPSAANGNRGANVRTYSLLLVYMVTVQINFLVLPVLMS